jgi:hypothetical protein
MIERTMRLQQGGEKVLRAYTREEAQQAGITDAVPWRQAEECRDRWVELDCGGIAELHRVLVVRERRESGYQRERKHIRTALGARWASCKRWELSEGVDDAWRAYSRSGRVRQVIIAYAQMMVASGTWRLTQEQMFQLERLFMPRQDRPDLRRIRFRMFLKTNEGKRMVAEEIANLLSKHNITPDAVVEGMQSLRERAAIEGKLNVELGVLRDFQDMLKMKPEKEQQQMQAIEVNWSRLLQEGDAAMPQRALPPAEE